MRPRDLTGLKFHRLTVESLAYLRRVNPPHRGWRKFWNCVCECGKECVVEGNHLGRGQVSCGCYRSEVISTSGGLGWVGCLVKDYRRNAKKRGLVWGLARSAAFALVTAPCAYCGEPPRMRKINTYSASANGIDRVDSARGYESGNVVPCCRTCNIAKGAMPAQEFLAWARRVAAANPVPPCA